MEIQKAIDEVIGKPAAIQPNFTAATSLFKNKSKGAALKI